MQRLTFSWEVAAAVAESKYSSSPYSLGCRNPDPYHLPCCTPLLGTRAGVINHQHKRIKAEADLAVNENLYWKAAYY